MTITGLGRSSDDETVKGKCSELKAIQEPKSKELVPGWLCGGWERKGDTGRNRSKTRVPGKGPEISPKGLYLDTDTYDLCTYKF